KEKPVRRNPLHRSSAYGTEECGVAESGPYDGDGDCPVDESRGPQGGDRCGSRAAGDCAGGGGDCRRDSKGRPAVLCGGGIERADGSAGRGGMSADVWNFAEAGAGADCGGTTRDYECRGRGGGFDAE